METMLAHEYNQDFYAWLMKNADSLRKGCFSEVDVDNVAEELESMGRAEKRELMSRLTVLLTHLLKWQLQSAKRSRSWRNTLTTQRDELIDLLEESPSLRYELEQRIEKAYEKAKFVAEDETGLDSTQFPQNCPFSFEQIIDHRFFPLEE